MRKKPAIVSLLPAATELACALGLEGQMAGISFECNYPPAISHLPRVVTTSLPTHGMTPGQIDAAVSGMMREGKSLYVIDEGLLASLRPDIILTQDLCHVCAPSGNELSQALAALEYKPQVIFMSPHGLNDIQGNLCELAAATGTEILAEKIIAGWLRRIDAVKARTARLARKPRVFAMEWAEPIYCSGHWLAEMIALAGGHDRFARPGEDSIRVSWRDIVEFQPEIIVLAPCGYDSCQAQAQLPLLQKLPGWESLPAVKNNRVYAVDADACFVRPGPRVIDGLEILSEIFTLAAFPDACDTQAKAARPVN